MGILRHPYGRSLRWRDAGYAIASWLGLRPSLDPCLVARRREELDRWQETFERYVEVICNGAHYGPTADRLSRFEVLQQQLRTSELGLIPGIGAYLCTVGPQGNALDCLLAPASLRELLANDDGDVKEHIVEVRRAAQLYARRLQSLQVS